MSRKVAGISVRHLKRLAKQKMDSVNENSVLNEECVNVPMECEHKNFNEISGTEIEPIVFLDKKTLGKNLANWCIEYKIPRTAIDALLKILSEEGMNVPKSSKTLLESKYDKLRTIEVPPGKYCHYGIEYSLQTMQVSGHIKTLLIDIGIDGLPLYKSSRNTLWPILGAIVGCPEIKPFLIGAYLGPSKPQNVNEYLKEFTEEVQHLQKEGITIDGRRLNFNIRVFTVDTPARAFLTNTVGHTSANGCSKCYQRGRKIKKTLAYSIIASEPRTDEDFTNRVDHMFHLVSFHNINSLALETLNIKMISQFPLDVMHLIDLGVGKKILTKIWEGKHNRRKLNNRQINSMNNTIIQLKKFIPTEFTRKPRVFYDIYRWKATEFRQVMLYTGIIILKDVLDDDLYYNFLLLYCAYRLISCPTNCQKNLSCVQELLECFVRDFAVLYGEDKVSYNIHNLLHLTDAVRMYGNVDNFSAYKFENYMQLLKKDCRRPSKILEQLNNRAKERSKFQTKPCKMGFQRLSNEKLNLTSLPIYMNYKCNAFYLSNSTPNNCCYVQSMTPIKIKGFFKDDVEEEYVIGCEFLNKKNFFEEPFESYKILGICIVDKTMSQEKKFKISDIYCKLVCLPFKNEIVLIPLLHQCTI